MKFMDKIEVLNDIKSNIVSWYDFKENATVLIIGEEVKQITQYLYSRLSKVVVVKPNEIQNIEEFEKFDYILIKDYMKCLENVKSFLKLDGTILLLLNNRFGINNFSRKNGISIICEDSNNVFGKNEIEEFLKMQGFSNYKFFYPLPNYEYSNVIFSDEYLPRYNHTKLFNNIVYDENESMIFNELQALKQITKAQNFKEFANSYFVEINPKTEMRFASFNNERKKEYRLCTKLYNDYVVKEAINEDSQIHISNMAQNIQVLKEHGFDMLDEFKDGKIISKYMTDKTVYQIVVDWINNDKIEEACKLIQNWFEEIKVKFACDKTDELNTEIFGKIQDCSDLMIVKQAYIDLVFENTFMIDNKFVFFDQEWSLKNIPLEFILYRAINNMYMYNSEIEEKLPRKILLEKFGLLKYLELFVASEKAIQDLVIDNEIMELYRKDDNILDLDKLINENNTQKQYIKKLTNEKDELKRRARLLEVEDKKKEDYIELLKKENQDRTNHIARLEEFRKKQEETINNLNEIIKVKEHQIEVYENMKIVKLIRKLKGKKLNRERKMINIKHIRNQIIFYIKKYGIVKTAKKCIKTVLRKMKAILKGKKDVNYGGYGDWIRTNEVAENELKKQFNTKFANMPKISLIVPMYNTNEKFFSELVDCLIAQTYSNWELCLADGSPKKNGKLNKIIEKDERIKYKFLNDNKGISGNSNEAIKMASGDYIALLDHDDLLSPYALYEVVKCINKNPEAQFIYSDEDKIDQNGNRSEGYFKPDFAPDTLRSQNYICHFSIFKKELMEKLGGFNPEMDGAQDYDIFLRMSEIVKPENIKHIPRILYHWRIHRGSTAQLDSNAKNYAFDNGIKAIEAHLKRVGLEGTVTNGSINGIYRVDYKVKGEPKVSIIIPNKDGKDILEVCVNSVLEKTTYQNYEIVIVENNSETEEIFGYYKELEKNEKIKVVNYPKKGFNYSGIINFGVKNSSGDYVIQLNNDTELLTPNWLEIMLGFAQREDVGAVGVKLYYPDETIQHAGIVVGLGGVAGNRFKSIPKDGHGYFARESMIENLTAVTAACIMTPKSVFDEVQGMDENLAVAFNDVDFCLKIREKGYLVVYNPFVEFTHYESKSRGYEDTLEKKKRFEGEIATFKKKWQNFLDEGDPYYNINLSPDTEVYHMRKDKIEYQK